MKRELKNVSILVGPSVSPVVAILKKRKNVKTNCIPKVFLIFKLCMLYIPLIAGHQNLTSLFKSDFMPFLAKVNRVPTSVTLRPESLKKSCKIFSTEFLLRSAVKML